jgi:hypothetical protein
MCVYIYTHTHTYILNSWYMLCFLVDYRQSTKNHNTYQLCMYIYIYSIPPDDGLQICLQHVEVDIYITVGMCYAF